MRHSLEVGASFGLTSGTITTLGLIVGLYSGTQSRLAVVGGVITIAVADALSDALGIHISEESENKHTPKEIWASTITTFLAKFAMAATFLIPVIFLELKTAVFVSVIWGGVALSILSYWLARTQNVAAWKVISEHLLIASIVVVVTHFLGELVSNVVS